MKQNLKKIRAVSIYGLNSQGVEVDILLDIPQFVAYMNSLTVQDFEDFKELKIKFQSGTFLPDDELENTFPRKV